MFSYIKSYKFTFIFLVIILFLSFFKPPHFEEVETITYFDKIVHCMIYFVFCSIIWIETRIRKKENIEFSRMLVFALLFPILLSGFIELGQEYLTTYRGAEWWDFIANSLGSGLSALLFYFLLKQKRAIK